MLGKLKKIKNKIGIKTGSLALGLLIALVLCAGIFVHAAKNEQPIPPDLPTLAQKVLENCKTAKYRPTCYEKEIPSLMYKPTNLSLEDSFRVAKIVQTQDNAFPYCHVLGHKIASQETKKDLGKWKQVINRCPSGICSNGCVHGAFQERFRTETLPPEEEEAFKQQVKDVCHSKPEWQLTGIAQGSCFHALGHLFTYLTQADLTKSVKMCQELAFSENGTDFTKVCFDGVYMQIFQPLENEDFALAKNLTPVYSVVDDG